MNKGAFAKKIHEQEVDAYKEWLCDTSPLNVRQGLDDIFSPNNTPSSLKELQLRHLGTRLAGNIRFGRNSFRDKDGVVTLDDILTLQANFNNPSKLGASIRSRPQFIKLIYQYLSCFSLALFDAYKEITGETLILDDLSEVREFYESCSQVDLWTGHELCAYISHSDPKALDFLSEHPEAPDYMSEDQKSRNFRLDKLENLLPKQFSRLFLRPDFYEKNATLVKAAILGEAFEITLLDPDNWERSSLKPQKGLEWAKKKGIEYHPVLDELLLDLKVTPMVSLGYTTPYLEMMQEVINELEISRDNQGKKEAIAALFAKKLADHKLTPLSQKLADAMATLVRLPESQQGRAKSKG